MRALVIFYAIIVILGLVGWIQCVIRLFHCDFDPSGSWKAEILYSIGACTGLGAILGWFNFGV